MSDQAIPTLEEREQAAADIVSSCYAAKGRLCEKCRKTADFLRSDTLSRALAAIERLPEISGPYENCTECGGRMAWDREPSPAAVWTCIRCMRRCREAAERRAKKLEAVNLNVMAKNKRVRAAIEAQHFPVETTSGPDMVELCDFDSEGWPCKTIRALDNTPGHPRARGQEGEGG